MNRLAKRPVLIGLVLLFLSPLSVELTVTKATPPPRRSTAGSRSAVKVGDLFRSNCARCHGADGRGDTPLGHTYNAPDFTDPEWWEKHSDITTTGSLVAIVSRGRGGMPAFGKKLKRPQIKLLVNYVRRFKNPATSGQRTGALVRD
jgi:mono/diheme cytochrome c family protein